MSSHECVVPDCAATARTSSSWCIAHTPEGPAGVTHLGPADPPTGRAVNSAGELVREEWRCATGLSRIGGPAEIEYEPGALQAVKTAYYLDGFLHREDGPAVETELSPDRFLRIYLRRGARHRENGPAEVFYREDGTVTSERYYRDGELHRLDGPASTSTDLGGAKWGEEFFVFGRRVTPEVMDRCRAAVEGGAPKEWALAYADGEVKG